MAREQSFDIFANYITYLGFKIFEFTVGLAVVV